MKVTFLACILLFGVLSLRGQCPGRLEIRKNYGWAKACDQVFSEGPMQKRKKHGTWKFYSDDGQVEGTKEFRFGERVGQWSQTSVEKWHTDSCFHDINENRSGEINCYTDGILYSTKTYYLDEKERIVSKRERFQKDGSLKEVYNFNHRGKLITEKE